MSQYIDTGKRGIDIEQWVKSSIAMGGEAELFKLGGYVIGEIWFNSDGLF